MPARDSPGSRNIQSKAQRQSQRLLQWKSRQAEEAVANRLRKHGYEILARNWRHNAGELDIVAHKADTLVFVEVKARRASEHGGALAAIDRRKRARLRLLAEAYVTITHLQDKQVRFDAAEVELDQAGFVRDIRYLENAFDSP